MYHRLLNSHTMWLTFVLWTLLGVASSDIIGSDLTNSTVVFQKCCPEAQSLMKVNDGFGNEKFKCIDSEYAEKNHSVIIHPLFVGEKVIVSYGVPEGCGQLLVSEVAEEIYEKNDNCYDRLVLEIVNDTIKQNIPQILSLACASQIKTQLLSRRIFHVRKCCPNGQSYDTEYHVCRAHEDSLDEVNLIKRLDPSGDKIYEVDTGLSCKEDEYAVELKEDSYSLNLEDNMMFVTQRSRISEPSIFMKGEWCVDQSFMKNNLVVRGCTKNCSLFDAFCVRKCCGVGQHYRPRRCGSNISSCVANVDDSTMFNLSYYINPLRNHNDFHDDVMGIRSSLRCQHGRFVLNRDSPSDEHYLTTSGLMVRPHALGGPTGDYCLETFDRRHCGLEVSVETIICFVVAAPQTKDFKISFVAISISCVFLFLTLLVYLALPELRNLHGKTLICHVVTMLFAFCCLARVQYGLVENKKICKFLGYGIYFGFVAAFSWLNVMCLDIWWTFGSIRTVQPLRRSGADRRRFLWYSLYAWSVSIVFTVTMLLLNIYPISPYLNSHIGENFCWFGSVQNSYTDWPHYIFFVMPMGIITCVNFVLWILTARHCHQVKSEVHRLQAGSAGDRAKLRFRADKARYVLTGKLWVVMGAGWMWELLSTLVSEPRWFWFIFDLINELQGFSIFLILVLKPKVYYLIRKRLGLETAKNQNGTSSYGGRTSSTFLSRAISTDDKALQRVSVTKNADKGN